MFKTHNKKTFLCFYLFVYFLLPLLNFSAQKECCNNLLNHDEPCQGRERIQGVWSGTDLLSAS